MDPSIAYLYIWPESTRLLKSLKLGDKRQIYTKSSVKFTEYLPDKVAGTVARLRHENVVRPAVDVDLNGLRTLIKLGHIQSALNLTTNLLTGAGQVVDGKMTLLCFEIWSIRFQLFMALKMYSTLIDELTPFEEINAPDTYLQYYADLADQKGERTRLNLADVLAIRHLPCQRSIVPYSLRLIHAEAAAFGTEPWTAFPRIQRLAENTSAAISIAQGSGLSSSQLDVWRKRLESVELMKARLFFKLKRYKNVFAICDKVARNTTDEARRREIFALLFRISMTVGSSARLGRYSEALAEQNLSREQQVIYESLKSIFYGTYEQAKQRQNVVLPNPTPKFQNNKAITSFYNGDVDDSLNTLFQHQGLMVEPIVVNIGTIADLVTKSSGHLLHKYFAEHCDGLPDVLNPESIKIDA